MPNRFITTHPYLILFSIVLVLRIATALPLQQAGYMDASYVMHVAENLARGQGFGENVLWNYLDNPSSLPHPSNLYWMPLPSLLVAPFYALLGASYRAAQIPFILISTLLPLFTFYLARRIFARDDYAWAAALFTAFSGFYTIYWVSPDNFAPFALTASVCLYVIARGVETESPKYFFIAGILAALSHLSRADGLLLLAVAPFVLYIAARRKQEFHASRITFDALRITFYVLRFTFYFFLGYFLLMSPWFLRNYFTVGTPYPSAGTKTLWLTSYDELFRFTDDLTWQRYLAWGVDNILASKVRAAIFNLAVVVLGALQLFLFPFAVIGLIQLRRRLELLPFFVYALLLYLAMTLAFTFPAMRGSMLHSAGAWLPFLSIAAPPGIDATIRWVARRRRTWDAVQASRFFRVGAVGLALFLSIYVYAQGIFPIGTPPTEIPLWNARDMEYAPIARWLDQNARADDIVMVVDPPGFSNVSHRRAIVIPTDSIAAVFAAAQKYNVRYLILQFDHPHALSDLYDKRTNIPGLLPLADFRDGVGKTTTLYEVRQ